MQEKSFDSRLAKRAHLLVHALIISFALNLGLFATFITWILREKNLDMILPFQAVVLSSTPEQGASIASEEVLKVFAPLSFHALAEKLTDDALVEQGYRKRDFALSCLVAYHKFDIERALPGCKLQKRTFVYKDKTIQLIPGLDKEHFRAIRLFAYREKWPLQPEGLFQAMKKQKGDLSPSLMQTFFISKEFYLIERALQRFPMMRNREMVLKLLLDGSWDLIVQTIAEIKTRPLGDIPSIGAFLARFKSSHLAAYLLIALDPDYPFKKFSDERLEHLIALLDQRTEEAKIFLDRIASSLRSDRMREIAISRRKSWGEVTKEIVVQKGDSLWSLAAELGSTVDEICQLNHLHSDTLFPGQVLKIPSKSQNGMLKKGVEGGGPLYGQAP